MTEKPIKDVVPGHCHAVRAPGASSQDACFKDWPQTLGNTAALRPGKLDPGASVWAVFTGAAVGIAALGVLV